MAGIKPYYTTSVLMQSIRNRIMMPFSQSTLQFNDVLQMVNEELIFNAVPAIRELHGEYFVYCKSTPLVSNVGIYQIPDRAQAMTLRDLNFNDTSGNFYEMTRIAEEDKAFFQYNTGSNQVLEKYYIQGDNVVLAQQMVTGPTGDLNFFIFLRPNLLVREERAATIQGFQKPFTITDNTLIAEGDIVLFTLGTQTSTPTPYQFTAVTTSPATPFQFQIGVTGLATAINLAAAINRVGINNVNCLASGNVVTMSYPLLASTFDVQSQGLAVDNASTYVQFDQLPTTYTDPDSNLTTPLYTVNSAIDFLQTNPGHRTYAYDVNLNAIMSGNIGKFSTADLMTYLSNSGGNSIKSFWPIKIGDYICLANECIIPQIPPEMHSKLAEMTASRILSALGDTAGYQLSQGRLQQMDKQEAALIGNRVEGSVVKVFNSSSLLRTGRRRRINY